MNEPNVDPDTGLPVLVKHPSEDRLFSMLFANLLVGTALDSVTSVSATSQGKQSGSTSVTVSEEAIAGDTVEFRIADGTDGENYEVTAEVVDSDGNTLVGQGVLYVRG